jgi:tetratricopeptide (TPR) repeat protein
MRTITILLALLLAAPAAADKPLDPKAQARYEAGKKHYDAQRWAEAIVEFRAAHAIDPRPALLYSIAQAQRLSGDCKTAADTYRQVVEQLPNDRLGELARANVERCNAAAPPPKPEPPKPEPPKPEPPPAPVAQPEPAPAPPPPAVAAPAPAEQPPRWYQDWIGNSLVIGGVVVGGVGLALWLDGHGDVADANASPDYDTYLERQDAAESGRTMQELGVAGIVIGAALIGGGIAHYVIAQPRSSATVGAGVTGDGAAILVRGSF